MTNNEFRMDFPSLSANESFARVAVASFVSQLDPTLDELADIKTAVSEAVTNCIVHGYKEEIGKIYITAKLLEDRRVVITVRDRGCGIPNIQQAMEPCFTTAPEEERSGMGFTIMQTFMDKLRVLSKPGSGTKITMEKKIKCRRR